jgi:hypothetical protein
MVGAKRSIAGWKWENTAGYAPLQPGNDRELICYIRFNVEMLRFGLVTIIRGMALDHGWDVMGCCREVTVCSVVVIKRDRT